MFTALYGLGLSVLIRIHFGLWKTKNSPRYLFCNVLLYRLMFNYIGGQHLYVCPHWDFSIYLFLPSLKTLYQVNAHLKEWFFPLCYLVALYKLHMLFALYKAINTIFCVSKYWLAVRRAPVLNYLSGVDNFMCCRVPPVLGSIERSVCLNTNDVPQSNTTLQCL